MPWYSDAVDSAINYLDTVVDSVSGTVTQFQQATSQQVAELRSQVNQFRRTYAQLEQFQGREIPAEYQADYNKVMAQGRLLSGFLNAVLGETQDIPNPDMQAAAPLIVGAVVAAALSAIAAWLLAATPLAENLTMVMDAGTGLAKSIVPVMLLGSIVYFWKDIRRLF